MGRTRLCLGGAWVPSRILLGGELGVYAPRCRSVSRGTPSKWEWRSSETALGMSSLRPAVFRSNSPSGGARSTAGSGAGRLGGSKAGP